ncbi:OmpL47-type beta-barrel domain-containing protein [Cohnella suwonensis]|uniref:OmpL47-type beta-barrel domain-containing protein n=1 Tax=Cohnella suwonensis TaxID=696072 RepID=A0ABW0LTM7_9BACL
MEKRISKKLSFLVSLLLLVQVLLPAGNSFAAETDNTMLPPSNLSYQALTPTDVKLTWSAVFGATGYKVYEITDGQLIARGTSSTTSFTINSLPEGQYTYVVSTLGPNGESGPCAPITVNIAYPDMAAPTLSYTVKNGNDIVLSWTASPYAQSYNLYQVQPDGQTTLVKTQTALTYTVSNAPTGAYRYAVTAKNANFGESPLSAPVEVDLIIPTMTAPGNATVIISNVTDVSLKWNAVSYATNYRVYQVVDGQKTLKSTVTGTTVIYTNQPAGEYAYEIYSYSDRFGESPEGAPVTFTLGTVTMAPPASLVYKLQNINDVVLTWTTAANANSYKIYQVIDGQKILKSTVTGTTVTYANQPAGDYTYEVNAYSDRFGESPEGTPVTFTIEATVMAAPANFAYKLQNINDVVLTWGTVPNANSYKIYQVVDGQKVLKSTVTTATVTYVNQPAGDYTYEVHSFSSRFGESPEGAQVTFALGAVTMAPPPDLAYKLQNINDIVLTWGASANANSYKIYQVIDGQKALKSTVTGTTVTYVNQPAGEYAYEVHSYSSRFGESPEGSEVKLTIEATIMAAPENAQYRLTNGNDIVLNWAATANATSYKVYLIANGQKSLKSTVTGTTVTYANQPQGDYAYEIHSFSTRFGESPEGSQVSFPLVYPTMEPPANLVQTIKNATDFSLTWDASAYATSYKVYQIVNGQKVLKSTVTGLTVTYTGMSPGEYTYEVHSVSTRFGESPQGTLLTMTLNGQTMQAPANPTYSIANGNDILLKWTAVPYATSYKIYLLVDGQKVLKSTVTGTAATYTNQPEGQYQYEIHSVSSILGESPEGAEITFALDFPIVAAPGSFAYKILNGNDIVLTWTAVAYANSYKVYEVVDGQKVLKNSVTTLTSTQTNVKAGEHTYIVHAISNRFGESPEGSPLTLTLVNTVMQAPGNFTKSIANGNDLILKWNAVTYATAYKLYQLVDGQEKLVKSQTGTTVTITNHPAGEFTYVVRSYSDRFGESAGSELAFTLVFPVMQAPGGFTKTISNGNDITLKWNAVTYASGYNLYKVVDGTEVLQKTQTGTTLTFTNMPEGDYSYAVRSYSSRFGESPEGGELQFTLDWPIMQAPGNLTKTVANGNDITLKWNAATFATAYRVYQLVDGQKVLKSTVTGTTATYVNMPAGDYSYVIHSYSSRFGESPIGAVSDFELVWPVVQPPVVAGTVFNANNMTLTWSSAAWANEYRVYKLTGGNRQLIYKGAALSYKAYNLSEDTHSFEVTAYNNRFGESAPSNRVTEKIVFPIMEPPVASIKLLSDTSARISWNFITYANGYNVYEIVDGQPVSLTENLNNLSFTVSDLSYKDHEYYVASYSNSFGESDKSNIVVAKLIVDTEAPVTTAEFPGGWTNESQTVALSATDNETGVAGTFYSLNEGEYIAGTSVKVDQAGVTKVSFYSVDKVGNKEAAHTIEVKIDKTAPVTDSNALEGWNPKEAAVNLTATDSESGVAKTYYSVDGSEFREGTSFTVSGDGIHQIRYYSIDQAGNKEAEHTVEAKVDGTAPVTVSNVPSTWTKEDVAVALTATDAESGAAKTFYAIDGSEYREGSSFTVSNEGIHPIAFYSVDKAGNIETASTADVKIDKSAPVVTMDLNEEVKAGTALKLSYSATDKLSGVADEKMTVMGPDSMTETAVTNGSELIVNKPGIYTVTVTVTDAVGLTTTLKKQFAVFLQATITVTPTVIKGNKGVFTVRVDLPDGYNSQGFDLNSVTLNGVKALNSNNGYYNQAKLGQFKFERSDFNWTGSEVTLHFRGYVNGILVVGEKTVKIQS